MSDILGYGLEIGGLAVLYYYFIISRKISEGWQYCINAIGFFVILGVLYYVIIPLPPIFSQNILNWRVQALPNSGHFLTVLPLWVFALLMAIKYKDSFVALLTTASFTAIHETIFTIIYEIHGFSVGRGAQLTVAMQAFIPSNFFFACVLIVWGKYYAKSVLNMKIFTVWIIIYTGAISVWAIYGFPITIDSYYGFTQYYNTVWVNGIEDLTWFIPYIGLYWAMLDKNRDLKIWTHLKSVKSQMREIYFEIKSN